MKPSNIVRFAASLFLIVLILASTGKPGYCLSDEEIFNWVADELEMEGVYAVPGVIYMDKEALGRTFMRLNGRSYAIWQAHYGSEQAELMLQKYLNETIGLFDPKTQIIYVADFLPACRRQAILAHEFTHYFQNQTHEFGKADQSTEESRHLFRELQAHKIESKFEELYCRQEE